MPGLLLRRGLAYCSLVLSLGCGQCAHAAVPVTEAGPPPAPHSLTATDLGAFLDGYLPIEMERADIAGAVVTVVKDGKVLLARGYGYADRARKTPVSPDRTLFRVGSISKVFTWTAVMQLVEAGKLDLDADIQRYLDFPVPGTFAQPITLRQLMTHTAGFQETLQDMWAQPGEPLDLRDYVIHHMPARIFAPGSTPAYSNYGATLAAYIVEQVSRQPFNAYVEQHLLQPLGMRQTTFVQPLPAALAPDMSAGYDNGSDEARPFELIRVAPAGSLSTSGMDMTRFMLAQLGEGDGAAILQPATRALMQTPQHRQHPAAPPMDLGMWQDGIVPQRVISHGGDTEWFHSGMYLMPDQHVGVFFSQNSNGKHSLRDQLFLRIAERYFPTPAATPQPSALAAEAPPVGWYMTSRRSETSPAYLMALLTQVHVSKNADGTLSVNQAQGLNDKPVRFHALGQGVWQGEERVGQRLFFNQAADGRWEMSSRVGIDVEQQVPWYRSMPLILATLVGSLLIAALTLAGWPVALAIRWHYGITATPPAPMHRARGFIGASAALTLLPWILFGLALSMGLDDPSKLMTPAFSDTLRLAQGAAWLAVASIPLVLWAAWQGWRQPGLWWWTRVHYTLVALAVVGAALMGWQSNLLLWNGRF